MKRTYVLALLVSIGILALEDVLIFKTDWDVRHGLPFVLMFLGWTSGVLPMALVASDLPPWACILVANLLVLGVWFTIIYIVIECVKPARRTAADQGEGRQDVEQESIAKLGQSSPDARRKQGT